MKEKGKATSGKTNSERKRKMVRLSGLTEGLITPALKQRSGYLRQLIVNWPQIMGDYASWAQPADIKMGRTETDKNILILSVHSARGPEASARSDELIDRVNRYFGFALIGAIRIKQDLPAHFHQTKGQSAVAVSKQQNRPIDSANDPLRDAPDDAVSEALRSLQKALREKSTST